MGRDQEEETELVVAGSKERLGGYGDGCTFTNAEHGGFGR